MPDENEHSPHGAMVTGHFHERHPYRVLRDKGRHDWLLVYTCAGGGRFGFQGAGPEPAEVCTVPGDMVLLRPGAPHDYGAARDAGCWELLWAHFCARPHWYAWLEWPQIAPGLLMLHLDEPHRESIARRLEDTHRLAMGAGAHREALATNALEEVILRCDARNPTAQGGRVDTRIKQTIDYLCQNLQATVSTPMLAAQCGLSPSRLTHLFRQQTGLSVQQFLEVQRLNRATQLLELTSRSVQDIAEEVGFSSPFYFSLRFKGHTGVSPRQYRTRT